MHCESSVSEHHLIFKCKGKPQTFYETIAKTGVDIENDCPVADIQAGKSFRSAMLGCSPCLTKSRGRSGGHYLVSHGRFMNIYEIGGLHGIPKPWVQEMLGVCPEAFVGQAFGDAMSMNVLMRVMPRAMFAAGLIGKLPADKWAAMSNVGHLPDCLYNGHGMVDAIKPLQFQPVWS